MNIHQIFPGSTLILALFAVPGQALHGAPPLIPEIPTIDLLKSVIFSQGLFVAVGDCGTILTSDEGLSWALQSAGTDDNLVGIAYGNARFLTVGESGMALTSTNGTNWIVAGAIPGLLGFVTGVASGANQFVAVTAASEIFSSSTGQGWSLQYTRPAGGSTDSLTGVAYNPNANSGRFAAVGTSGEEADGLIIHSDPSDVTRWSRDARPVDEPYSSVVFAFDRFLALSEGLVRTSLTGTIWRQQIIPEAGALLSGGYVGTTYYAIGECGEVFTSADSVTWAAGSSFQGEALYGFTVGNQRAVIVGDCGSVLTAPCIEAPWVDLSEIDSTEQTLTEAAFGANRYVALGSPDSFGVSPMVWLSTNRVRWEPARVVVADVDGIELTGLTYAASRFVAVGAGLTNANVLAGIIVTSVDGCLWTSVRVGTNEIITDVAFGNGAFIAVGESRTMTTQGGSVIVTTNNLVLRSTTGQFWSRQSTPAVANARGFSGVTHGGAGFMAVGPGGAIFKSNDGITWAAHSVPAAGDLEAVAYGNSHYAAVGFGEDAWVSTNGMNWQAAAPLPGAVLELTEVFFANGTFFAFGCDGILLRSTNAIDWERQYSRTTAALGGGLFANATYLAFGEEGTVLASGDGLNWTVQSGREVVPCPTRMAIHRQSSNLEITITGEPGLRCRIESVNSLGAGSWGIRTRLFLDGGTAIFRDSILAGTGMKFYRAISE